MKTIIALLIWMVVSVSTAFGALIVVNDGDEFTYNPDNQYHFNAFLAEAKPMVTFGVNIAEMDAFDFIVTAPSEFDLFARVRTGPNFTGLAVSGPDLSTVFAGTSFALPIAGNSFAIGQTLWLSIAFADIDSAAAYLVEKPGGILLIGGVLSSPEANFTFLGGATNPPNGGGGDTGGGNGDGGGSISVPEPASSMLALMGLSLLLFSQRLRRKVSGVA